MPVIIARVLKLIFGLTGSVFFSLALVGFLAVPDKGRYLPTAVLSAVLLFICLRLLRGAIKTPKRVGVGDDIPVPAEPKPDKRTQPVLCPRCGARDIPGEDGCCTYCGGKVE